MQMSFYEIPRNTTHVGHTQSLCRGQERQAALAPLAGESDIDLEETDVQEILVGFSRVTTVAWRAAGESWLQTRDKAHHWWETIPS